MPGSESDKNSQIFRNPDTRPTEIPVSNRKSAFLLTGAILFSGMGVWLVMYPKVLVSNLIPFELAFRLLGIVTVVFFGYGAVVIAKKMKSVRIGLRIDTRGITDQSHGSSAGFIPWEDIDRIETVQIAASRFLVLHASDPRKYQAYIDNATTGFARAAMLGNLDMLGSPLTVTSASLQISFADMERCIRQAHSEWQAHQKT